MHDSTNVVDFAIFLLFPFKEISIIQNYSESTNSQRHLTKYHFAHWTQSKCLNSVSLNWIKLSHKVIFKMAFKML